MKIVMTNSMLACFSLMIVSLMFTNTSTAEFDPKTVVGMWLFDEGKGIQQWIPLKTAMMGNL